MVVNTVTGVRTRCAAEERQMTDEPQDPTEDPEDAEDAAEEPSPSGEGDDDTSAAGGEGTHPDVAHDEEGVAAVTDHSTKLSESEKADPISPGQPRGIDPKTLKDRDSPPQL
jgi:hypothetical protein